MGFKLRANSIPIFTPAFLRALPVHQWRDQLESYYQRASVGGCGPLHVGRLGW